MKRCSKSLCTREMKIKNYEIPLYKNSFRKKTDDIKCWPGKGITVTHTLVGKQNDAATLENRCWFFIKLNIQSPYNPQVPGLGSYPGEKIYAPQSIQEDAYDSFIHNHQYTGSNANVHQLVSG